ncbi:hypothetical protein J6590_002699 [Homalodisca vitripennis]|nr:hypothetical protein J6590_002699 [Homalodisca vitripennis]
MFASHLNLTSSLPQETRTDFRTADGREVVSYLRLHCPTSRVLISGQSTAGNRRPGSSKLSPPSLPHESCTDFRTADGLKVVSYLRLHCHTSRVPISGQPTAGIDRRPGSSKLSTPYLCKLSYILNPIFQDDYRGHIGDVTDEICIKVQYAVYYIQAAIIKVQYNVCYIQAAFINVQYAVYYIQAVIIKVQYAVYYILGALIKVQYNVYYIQAAFIKVQYDVYDIQAAFIKVQYNVYYIQAAFIKVQYDVYDIQAAFIKEE